MQVHFAPPTNSIKYASRGKRGSQPQGCRCNESFDKPCFGGTTNLSGKAFESSATPGKRSGVRRFEGSGVPADKSVRGVTQARAFDGSTVRRFEGSGSAKQRNRTTPADVKALDWRGGVVRLRIRIWLQLQRVAPPPPGSTHTLPCHPRVSPGMPRCDQVCPFPPRVLSPRLLAVIGSRRAFPFVILLAG
jgi:hypothetical protein